MNETLTLQVLHHPHMPPAYVARRTFQRMADDAGSAATVSDDSETLELATAAQRGYQEVSADSAAALGAAGLAELAQPVQIRDWLALRSVQKWIELTVD